MRYGKLSVWAIFFILIISPAQARDFELAVSNESIHLSYLSSSNLLEAKEQNLNFGVLFTEERDIVANLGIGVPGLLSNVLPDWLSFEIGARGYFSLISDPQDIEIFSLAPGIDAQLTLPTDLAMRIRGSFYYAPKILTFGDADKMFDATVRFEVGFAPNTTGFIGYRLLRYEHEASNFDIDVDDGVHIGVRASF